MFPTRFLLAIAVVLVAFAASWGAGVTPTAHVLGSASPTSLASESVPTVSSPGTTSHLSTHLLSATSSSLALTAPDRDKTFSSSQIPKPGQLDHRGASTAATKLLPARGHSPPLGPMTILEEGAQQSGSPANWQTPNCYGIWPGLGNLSYDENLYVGDCYGHDEPGVQFYSNLPGSGGNVSWNVTLPIDRSATQNQSNLYGAIWFGMTMTAPSAWLDECFLELQFYPDLAWRNVSGPLNPLQVSDNGNWVGAAVAWQIQTSTSRETPCFYEPLYLNGHAGPSYLNMTQGDAIAVTMTGWTSNPSGENISITDVTSGEHSFVTMYNSSGRYPVNPAYSTNSYENGLHWTPGGGYPVVFSFETGHAGNPSWPRVLPYGGCLPGPPGGGNVGVPCPSYDPGSWANDTLRPWHIDPPTFFNLSARETPVQVAFTQTFGGIGLVSQLDGGTCGGLIGTSWCSYPWYSYSCAARAFEFGATDYPGVSSDFGQFNQYAQSSQVNNPGFRFYPPTNFSIPTCGGPSFTLDVGAAGTSGGSVFFLSQLVAASTGISGLGPGEYSVSPLAPPGGVFQRWITAGGVRVEGAPTDAWAALLLTGDGTVTAEFNVTVPKEVVTFDAAGPGSGAASVVVSQSLVYTTGIPLARVASGGSLALDPGIYGIQAASPTSTNFSGWSGNNRGVAFAAPSYPYTSLIVTGVTPTSTVTATYTVSPSLATVLFGVPPSSGGGTLTFNGISTSGMANDTVPVGTYGMLATPALGNLFVGWAYSNAALLTDFEPATNVTVELGYSLILAKFAPIPSTVTIAVVTAPGQGGAASFTEPGVAQTTVSNGTSFVGPTNTTLVLTAVPYAGYHFTNWSVNNSRALLIYNLANATTDIQLRAAATLTANYAPAPTVSVTFVVNPPARGWMIFNALDNYTGGTTLITNSSIARGNYSITAVPNPGFAFVGFASTGGVAAFYGPLGDFLSITGPGTLVANFAQIFYALTFVANTPVGVTASFDGTNVTSGSTIFLGSGTHSLTIALGSSSQTFTGWWPGPGLTVNDPSSSAATLTVNGISGTIYAIVAPFGLAPPRVSTNPTEVGFGVAFITTVSGTGTFSFFWQNLPGCFGPAASSFNCTPTVNGTFLVSLMVNDSAGESAFGSVSLTVNQALSARSLIASPRNVTTGDQVSFTVVSLGGVFPLSYSWGGLPGGCSGTDSLTLTCSPTSSGRFTVAVTITDALGRGANASTPITVASRSSSTILGLAPNLFYITLGVIAVVVVIGVIALVSRGRKGPPAPPPLAFTPSATGPLEGDSADSAITHPVPPSSPSPPPPLEPA